MARVGPSVGSAPERFALLGVAAAGAAVVYPVVHSATGYSWPCPLRTVTGIPCPMCGMTTAATALVRGRVGDALTANPFVLVLAVGVVVMLGVVLLRWAGVLPSPRELVAGERRLLRVGLTLLFLASWLFQLNRYDWI